MPESLEQYLDQHAAILGRQAERQLKPLHVPGITPLVEGLESLKRKPFEAQSHVITSIARAFENQDAVFLVGQVGTGKSLCGGACAHLAGAMKMHSGGRAYRALILAPKHLTMGKSPKWARELMQTLPGVEVRPIRHWKDAMALRKLAGTKPEKPQWFLLSRDTSKLGVGRVPSVFKKLTNDPCKKCLGRGQIKVADEDTILECQACMGTGRAWSARCPQCGGPVANKSGPIPVDKLAKKRTFCENIIHASGKIESGRDPVPGERVCGSPLWQYKPTKSSGFRWPPATIIKELLPKGFFDYAIFDEVHENRSESAQGTAMGQLAASAKYRLAMTGTISTGTSESLRLLLFRLRSRRMKELGFEWSKPTPFNERYGRIETTIKERESWSENRQSKGRSVSKKVVPGVLPNLFGDLMMDCAVFLTLDDVAENLPPYSEVVVPVAMSCEQRSHYDSMEKHLRDVVAEMLSRNDRRLLGAMLSLLLAWPDYPYDWKPTGYTERELTLSGTQERFIHVLQAPSLAREKVYPKEEAIIDECLAEKSEGRKCWLYVQFTDAHDVLGRYESLLNKHGLRAKAMRASLDAGKREDWIYEHAPGHDVLLSHPKLTQTGLDFFSGPNASRPFNIPTILFAEPGTECIVSRQAAGRSYRIGQTKECRVRHFYYENSLEARLLALMGKKVGQSMALEGRFSSEGLAALDDDSMEIALAKSLVGGLEESVHRSWAKVDAGAGKKKPSRIDKLRALVGTK